MYIKNLNVLKTFSVICYFKISDKTDEDDEVIRCICNIYKDEGLMIQCEKCLVCTC